MRAYLIIRLSSSQRIFIILCLLFISNFRAQAQQEFDNSRGTHKWIGFSDAPNALYHHLAAQAFAFLEKRDNEVARLSSLEDWQKRQGQIKETLMDIVGPFPERTPLNPKITKVIKKDGYYVENIIYESQPGFHVTASLFIPAGLKKRKNAPAVIYCSGHTEDGYRSNVYQNVILNLVMKGFIVFAIDPIGQGERIQYPFPDKEGSEFRSPSSEHSYAGAPLFMTGSSLAKYMIWDGIRAVDYLRTRKEVDPDRIGITGRSGGGTQSAIIAAFDERIKAAAPENYITNLTMLLQSIGPQCAEQNLFHGIARGMDMADLLLVRAPKPALMITTTRDMFPIHGSIETAKEVSRLYEAYGKADSFGMVTDDAPHASTKKNRESLYAFFQKHLNSPGDSTDTEYQTLSNEELQVTGAGQVATSLKGETVFSLNLKQAENLHGSLQAARKDARGYLPEMLKSAKRLSGYRPPDAIGTPVFTGRIQRDGYIVEKYFIKGEGAYVIPYLLMQPEKPSDKALIYLDPRGKSSDSNEGGTMEWFVKKGFTVLAPDMIGTGEMGPGQFRGDSYIDSVSYNIWFASMLIGRSITGIQTGDVVRLARLLEANKAVRNIYGLAKRQMVSVLLHAAAFDEAFTNLALIEPYTSYRSVVMNHYYNPEFVHSTVPGSIGVYDLPDLAASLAPEKLLVVGATDGTGKATDSEIVSEDMSFIKTAYDKDNATSRLRIVDGPVKEYDSLYEEWINDKK